MPKAKITEGGVSKRRKGKSVAKCFLIFSETKKTPEKHRNTKNWTRKRIEAARRKKKRKIGMENWSGAASDCYCSYCPPRHDQRTAARPVTTFALGVLLASSVGRHGDTTTVIFSLAAAESPPWFMPNRSSNSPEKLAADTCVAVAVEEAAVGDGATAALSPKRTCGDSHLARMYSGFRHGGKCRPFFFRLCLAAYATTATICPRRSGVPTNSGGSAWRAARYAFVERATSNSDRKSTSTMSLTPSPTTASMYWCSPAG